VEVSLYWSLPEAARSKA